MIKPEYMVLLRDHLKDHSIALQYDRDSSKRFFAEIIHFLLFFVISFGLLFKRFILANDESHQIYWDLALSLILLIWSIFVLARALLLKPEPGTKVIIDRSAVSIFSKHEEILPWDDLDSVYVWPWCVAFRGAKSIRLRISFLHKDFERTKKLFALLVTQPPRARVKAFEKESEIKGLLESLVSNSPANSKKGSKLFEN